jgi:bifunctional polynucleotide phosphatase/kinase
VYHYHRELKKAANRLTHDQDSTLTSTASGASHSRDANDWAWWHGSVPARLRALHADGFALLVFSNQAGLKLVDGAKAAEKVQKFKRKVGAALAALDLPVSVYAATEKDGFRKPATGMWERALGDRGWRAEDVDHKASFFVGDAAGRLAGMVAGKKVAADFSASDRHFAENVGVGFQTPEEYFLGKEARDWSSFDPKSYFGDAVNGS